MQRLCQVSQGPDLWVLARGGGCFCAPVQGATLGFEAENQKIAAFGSTCGRSWAPVGATAGCDLLNSVKKLSHETTKTAAPD
jgi:hypothetical protein